MESQQPSAAVAPQKFTLRRFQVPAAGETAAASDADLEKSALDEMGSPEQITAKVKSMKPSAATVQDFDDIEELPDAPVPPAAAAPAAEKIGDPLLDMGMFAGYAPEFGGGSQRPDPSRIPRADGTWYSEFNPGERVYENKPNLYGKQWIEKKIALKKALAKDPMYYLASQVAGRTGRTAMDLIEDPLKFAAPDSVRPDPRLTVKDAFYPVVPGASGTVQSAAGLPGFYSKEKILNSLKPERLQAYKDVLAAKTSANRQEHAELDRRALAIVVADLMKKWNDVIRANPEMASRLPPRQNRNEYLAQLASLRDGLMDSVNSRLAELYSVPLGRLGGDQYAEIVSARQDIAELAIIKELRWPEGQYEALPGYEVLKKVFDTNDPHQMREALDSWDKLFNNGLFAKQRLLAAAAESKRSEDAAARQRGMLELLEGKGATSLDQKAAGKPAADVRWMSLPENLGVIFFKENLQAAVDQSLADIASFCDKGRVEFEDLITGANVQSYFFDLVSTNLRLWEIYAPRRNEEFKLLRPLHRRRLELLVKFCTLEYSPVTGELFFTDQTDALLGGIGKMRIRFARGGGRGGTKRPSIGTSSPSSDRDWRTTYTGRDSARAKRSSLRTGAEVEEYERSKEFFETF